MATLMLTLREMHLPAIGYPYLSLFSYIPSEVIIALCILHMLLALGVAVGWKTRILQIAIAPLTFALFFHSMSQYHNHYAFSLFITIYLTCVPTERYYSLDALQKKRRSAKKAFDQWQQEPVSLYGQRLIMMQLGLMYFFGAINKMHPEWFMRWAVSKEPLILTQRSLFHPIVEVLYNADMLWLPVSLIIATMLSLSVGIFFASRYPVIAFVGMLLHVFYQLSLDIVIFSLMCMFILFLAVFPRKSL